MTAIKQSEPKEAYDKHLWFKKECASKLEEAKLGVEVSQGEEVEESHQSCKGSHQGP